MKQGVYRDMDEKAKGSFQGEQQKSHPVWRGCTGMDTGEREYKKKKKKLPAVTSRRRRKKKTYGEKIAHSRGLLLRGPRHLR